MKEQFRQYIINLYHDIPQEVYEGLLSIFCIGLVVFIAWKGFKTGLRYSATLLLIEYIFLLFCPTVIFRATGTTRQCDFHPFWSYDRPDLLIENIMNVIVFIPVGMILGSLLRFKGLWSRNGSWLRVKGSWSKYGSWFKVNGSWSKYGSWFKVNGSWLIVLLIGCSISVTIEALQFWFMKGFSEVDDVMHNTVGCLIGYGVYAVVRYGFEIACKRSVGVLWVPFCASMGEEEERGQVEQKRQMKQSLEMYIQGVKR